MDIFILVVILLSNVMLLAVNSKDYKLLLSIKSSLVTIEKLLPKEKNLEIETKALTEEQYTYALESMKSYSRSSVPKIPSIWFETFEEASDILEKLRWSSSESGFVYLATYLRLTHPELLKPEHAGFGWTLREIENISVMVDDVGRVQNILPTLVYDNTPAAGIIDMNGNSNIVSESSDLGGKNNGD